MEMEQIDPNTAARVWQRVQGAPNLPGQPSPQSLILREHNALTAYQRLAKQLPEHSRIISKLVENTQQDLACLRGIATLQEKPTPALPQEKPVLEPPALTLRKCYGATLSLGAAYDDLSADREYGCDSWELYGFDLSEGAFRSMASLQDGDEGISKAGALAYVHGHLYHISNHNDIDDWSAPSRMCLRCFDFDARLFGEEYRLEHAYDRLGLISVPKVAVVGKSMYVFATEKSKSSTPPPVYELTGLERVDFDDDGNPSCVDLSDALMLLEKQTDTNDACIAASKDGVFLISPYMEDLLPDGADRTDTFFLKNDGTQFEPYPRTLSFAQFTYPVSVYSNGWLYAYGVSKYEDTTIFGRATKVTEDEKPDPDVPDDPTPEPTPTPSPLPKTGDVGDTLCRCSAVLFLVGLSSVAVGLKTLRPRREADE
jgi:hypothetical protein